MSEITINKYPLDLTGQAPTNLKSNERFLLPRVRGRWHVPVEGPFYNHTVKIYRVSDNYELQLDLDYEIKELHQEATLIAPKPVSQLIVFTNPNMYGELTMDYQLIGGPYTTHTATIEKYINGLRNDTRTVRYTDILDAPTTANPKPHLHNLMTDIYGFDAVIAKMQQLIDTIRDGSVQLYQAVNVRIDGLVTSINGLLQKDQAIDVTLNGHDQDIQLLQQQLTTVTQRLNALESRVVFTALGAGALPYNVNAMLTDSNVYTLPDPATVPANSVTRLYRVNGATPTLTLPAGNLFVLGNNHAVQNQSMVFNSDGELRLVVIDSTYVGVYYD